MEFNEKLQQLRKQNNMTQEQLAEKLYVSRAAVSKWESGKGYPNIESLKAISKLFSVSIDDLLSGNELLTLAETENRTNINTIYGLMFGILDLAVLIFFILPLFGEREADDTAFQYDDSQRYQNSLLYCAHIYGGLWCF